MSGSQSSPVVSATVLGKRKAESFVLHLSSASSYAPSDSELELDRPANAKAGPSHAPILVNGNLIPHTSRRYKCTHQGCDKAYTKPSRLEEHERSHTGQRPYVCNKCNKSYLRETHLQAHARSHLPESARPFQCSEVGCAKRFWTSQHLRVHENWHKGEKPFQCPEPGCEEAFSKHHQLRSHACTVHAPPGTKPFQCEHEGCTKSFATSQKLRTHTKVHDDKRYTCVHAACLEKSGDLPSFYPTWTALQHHMRTVHPPTCPHPSCRGKIFTTQRGMRAHQKLHEQRDAEEEIDEAVAGSDADDDAEAEQRPRKKRRGGEIGRDWRCEEEGCGKDFKSKQALTTHHNITHLGRRDFVCPHTDCGRAFGYNKLLQRHLAKAHSPKTSSSSSENDSASTDVEDDVDTPRKKKTEGPLLSIDIDDITGAAYATRAASGKALHCPFPNLHEFGEEYPSMSAGPPCEYAFTRAYDLRRHLRAEHDVEVEKEAVDAWVGEAKAAAARKS
ncbi:hypothetical protein PLICRDRAFT_693882 [Plicaturopsis crispa FD-325 SS-3]|nr:hypothetical protein PLICRDRAFT_693882 [Plicaturopsis crispa FD-325 SS-3]